MCNDESVIEADRSLIASSTERMGAGLLASISVLRIVVRAFSQEKSMLSWM